MSTAQNFDIVIVGGGPAALAAAVYAGRAQLKTIILERAGFGGQVALTHAIDNYPGFPKGIAGPELTELMKAQAERFGVETVIDEVTRIDLDGSAKLIQAREGTYRADVVILAMGADPRKLGIPGEEEFRGRGVSYCGTCDAPFFRNKKVVAVGGGDTALKEALFIARFAREVALVHRRCEFRAERIYQEEIKRDPKLTLVLEFGLTRILGTAKVEAVEARHVKTGETRRIDCDGVFIFVGTEPNTRFLTNLFPDAAGRLLPTDKDMMTALPGIYAVGDVRQDSYRQVATAVGEGATAAIAAEHWLSKRRAGGA